LAVASPPLGAAGEEPSPLSLFAARRLSLAAAPQAARVAAVEADAVIFAGAPVWALDWRPAGDGEEACDWLAVGTSAAAAPPPLLGRAASGPGALQLWRVERPSSAPAAVGGRSKKRGRIDEPPTAPPASLALLLSHDRGCCWDVAWWPGTAPLTAGGARLGLLATAFGDGTIAVTALQRPAGGAGAPLAAALLQPAWRGAAAAAPAGGPLAWTLAWQLSAPHSRLAVRLPAQPSRPRVVSNATCRQAGSTDGRVFLWDLSGADARAQDAPPEPPHVVLLGAPPLPLRALAWAPAALGAPPAAILAAAGGEGGVCGWDARSPGVPAWRSRTAHSFIYRLAWRARPRGLLAASEAGLLLRCAPERLVAAHHLAVPLRASSSGTALWGLALEGGGRAAVCGADGDVTVTSRLGARGGARGARVAALRVAQPAGAGGGEAPPPPVALLLEGAAPRAVDLPEKDEDADSAPLPCHAREQAMHRVAWAPAAGRDSMLVAGGQAGLLRLLVVRLAEDETEDED
jgi:hypothetical protein